MTAQSSSPLNPLQISLLRLFERPRPMTDEQILSLKRVLVKHYSTLLNEELDKVISDKNYTQEDYDKMLGQQS